MPSPLGLPDYNPPEVEGAISGAFDALPGVSRENTHETLDKDTSDSKLMHCKVSKAWV